MMGECFRIANSKLLLPYFFLLDRKKLIFPLLAIVSVSTQILFLQILDVFRGCFFFTFFQRIRRFGQTFSLYSKRNTQLTSKTFI
jgi:hypothetical protein